MGRRRGAACAGPRVAAVPSQGVRAGRGGARAARSSQLGRGQASVPGTTLPPARTQPLPTCLPQHTCRVQTREGQRPGPPSTPRARNTHARGGRLRALFSAGDAGPPPRSPCPPNGLPARGEKGGKGPTPPARSQPAPSPPPPPPCTECPGGWGRATRSFRWRCRCPRRKMPQMHALVRESRQGTTALLGVCKSVGPGPWGGRSASHSGCAIQRGQRRARRPGGLP